jgi:hypothetical protein
VNGDRVPDQPSPAGTGGSTAADGTPVPVDLTLDRRSRRNWAVFLAGPVIWFSHFMVVYLAAEAGCTGDGPGLEVLDPPVPVVATLVATVVAVALCAAATWWGWRWWQEGRTTTGDGRRDRSTSTLDDEGRSASLGFAGTILSAFSLLAVLFTAAPALVLGPC